MKDKPKDSSKLKGLEEMNKRIKKEWEKVKDMIDVPAKFADPEKSGLKFEIKPGPQVLNIELPKSETPKQGDDKKSDDKKSDDKKGDN